MDALLRRRQILSGAALVPASVLASSCGFFSTETSDGDESRGSDDAKESPMLTERVQEGSLPELSKRLPRNPLVVKTVQENGVFGGTIHRALTAADDVNGGIATISRVGLVEFDVRTYEPGPALAESWEIADGARRFTFTLRDGVKWSDGKPFTTDDIEFYFVDYLGNETLNAAPPTWYVIGGEPGKFTKLDATRFRLEFKEPHGLLLKYLAFEAVAGNVLLPKHYLSQFHPEYADEAQLQKAAKDAGHDSWDLHFENRRDIWVNAERPYLGPWILTQPATGAANRARIERNPYYWKTDSDGRQLPYIDAMTYDVMDVNAVVLRAASGGLDYQSRYLHFGNMPVLQKSAENNNYNVKQWTMDGGRVALYMNQCHTDPVKRELFQNRDFRAALSHAINRQEMNDALFTGVAPMTHPGPLKEDPTYIKGFGKTFTEFDADRANELLDSLNLDSRDGDGWRLREDGKRLDLGILTYEAESGTPIDGYEMVTRYWKAVGIRASLKVVSSELWRDRVSLGEVDVPGYSVGGFYWDIDPLWFVPTSSYTYWAPLFGVWYETGGAEGEEPPPDLRRLQDIYDELKATPDAKKRAELGKEIIRAHDENVWIMGTVSTPFQPVVASNDLVNVVDESISSFRLMGEGATWPEQIFYRNPEDH